MAKFWRLGWSWYGSAVKEPQKVVPPRQVELAEIVGVRLKKGHPAQQLCDVVAREMFGVAGEKGW